MSPPRTLSRRELLRRAALVGGAAAIAPFSFVRSATAATDAELRAFVLDRMRAAKIPGVSPAVVKGDEAVWSHGAGWANRREGIRVTPDTAFMLASISKTVTCAGVMAVVQDGLLDLDGDVNEYLPFEVHIPAAPDVPVTMRQLLCTPPRSVTDRGRRAGWHGTRRALVRRPFTHRLRRWSRGGYPHLDRGGRAEHRRTARRAPGP